MEDGTINHLFFECEELKSILKEILKWMEIERKPREWNEELLWIIRNA
ncbi:unnamed protein product [Lathyrus oleraceus]